MFETNTMPPMLPQQEETDEEKRRNLAASAGAMSVMPPAAMGQPAQPRTPAPVSKMPPAAFGPMPTPHRVPDANGQIEPGNIDLYERPVTHNPDGTTSSVRSASFGTDKGETLVPTVSTAGKLQSNPQAIDSYRKTGQHLGIFGTPEAADKYGEQLHNDYAAGKYGARYAPGTPENAAAGASNPPYDVMPPMRMGSPEIAGTDPLRMPPMSPTAGQPPSMPPLKLDRGAVPNAELASGAMPAGRMPAMQPPAPPVNPAQKRYEDLVAQGEPKLPWWKRALDVAGSLHPLGREIEAQIPGSPQNYSMKLNQAGARAAKEQELGKGNEEIAASQSRRGISEQESKLVPVPDHPEMGLVEQKNLAAIERQLAGNQGKTDVADINQAGATEREQMKIDAKPAVANGIKFGVLKPDIVAQIGPMPEDPELQKAWGEKYDALAAKSTGKQTGIGTYAMVRLLDYFQKYNPEGLKLMPEILKHAGIDLPAGMNLASIPPGQPTDERGNPIGNAQPGAPTGATRSRGQLAEGMLVEMPRVKKEISEAAHLLGPMMGRWNDFMVGHIGGGDDPNYPLYQKIRTDMKMLTSGASKMHLNSVESVKAFDDMASAGKMTAPVLNAFIDTVEKWAGDYARQGRGHPAGGGDVQTHNGYEYTKGSDGQWHKGNRVQ